MGSVLNEALTTLGKQWTTDIISVIAKDEATYKVITEKFKDKSLIDKSKLEGVGLISSICSLRNMMLVLSNWMYYVIMMTINELHPNYPIMKMLKFKKVHSFLIIIHLNLLKL